MKLIQTFVAALMVMTANTAFAKSNYVSDYYKDEGALWFKVSGFYLNTSPKHKNLPDVKNAGTEKPGKFSENGYGAKASVSYFLTDHIAAELSVGIGNIRVKNSELLKAREAYQSLTAGKPTSELSKNNDILYVPVAATLQYHIAPFGGVRPYIGGGYHVAYMHTNSKAIQVTTGHGGVLQAGIDFVAKDDTVFTIGVTQYFLESKIKYKKEFLSKLSSASAVESKVKWNPLVISAGIGFKF